jgi:hypothetical protein
VHRWHDDLLRHRTTHIVVAVHAFRQDAPARLYRLRSNGTISPAAGKCAT